ncbi:MAG TPA: RidA family protein [Stellaceae bacterium]|nr:RidA family protein [Stellaceae bacterium]
MAGEAARRLQALGLVLPPRRPPTAHYAHARRVGDLLYVSGQDPEFPDGSTGRGRLGAGMSVEEGYLQARQVGLTLLAAMQEALGDLDRIAEVVKVLGMVNATPDFTEHPRVIDGCSDLFVAVFGERGRHARSAVGMSSLPDGIPVEIEAVVTVTPEG